MSGGVFEMMRKLTAVAISLFVFGITAVLQYHKSSHPQVEPHVSTLRDAVKSQVKVGGALTCGMKDLNAKPWLKFVVSFKADGQAPMEYYQYPSYGTELMAVARPLGADTDEGMQFTAKRIYISWGGDGDAAYVSLRKKTNGNYGGNFWFPNGGVANFGDEEAVPVTCTLKSFK